MASSEQQQRPVRLLSLDGGGIRGISELVILDELMRKLKGANQSDVVPRPCEVFDLIGGTSTGGLIALMLGRLRMTVEETISEYITLAEYVFSVRKPPNHADTFKATRLEKAIKDVVQRRGFPKNGEFADPELPLIDHDSASNTCKIFVCSRNARNMATPRLFRSYPIDSAEEYANMTIWQAGRATSAAPTFFKRVFIGPKNYQEEFIDGGMGCNNPVSRVLEEAQRLFPDRRLACILSIGTGKPSVTAFSKPGPFQAVLPKDLIKALGEMVTDTETTEVEVSRQFQELPIVYYRLNVEQGLQNIDLDEWKKLAIVKSHTLEYLKTPAVQQNVERLVQVLQSEAPQVANLPRLSSLGGPIHRIKACSDNIPALLVSHFVGQESILESIRTSFDNQHSTDSHPSSIVVLRGMGGSGKTQIALKYCIQAKQSGAYDAVLWADATSHASLSRSYEGIAPKINASSTVSGVVESLKNLNFLLVLDNYDDMASFPNIRDFIASSHTGHIIVTSRDSDASRLGRRVSVDGMSTEDAIKLLYLRSENDKDPHETATQLVSKLGCLPLAVDIAGSFIAARGLSFQKFLEMFEERKDALNVIPDGWEYCKSVDGSLTKQGLSAYTTLELSFNLLTADTTSGIGRVAANLLTLSSFLNWSTVSEFFLAPSFSDSGIEKHVRVYDLYNEALWRSAAPSAVGFATFSEWREGIRTEGELDSSVFADMVVKLSKLSLIQKCWTDTRGICFSIHPVVASWLQYRLSSRDRAFYAKDSMLSVWSYISFSHSKDEAVESKKSTINDTLVEFLAHLWSIIRNEKFLKDDQKMGCADMAIPGWEACFELDRHYELNSAVEEICVRVAQRSRKEVKLPLEAKLAATLTLMEATVSTQDMDRCLAYGLELLSLVQESNLGMAQMYGVIESWGRCSTCLLSEGKMDRYIALWTAVFNHLHLYNVQAIHLITTAVESANSIPLLAQDAEEIERRCSSLLVLFRNLRESDGRVASLSYCSFVLALARLVLGQTNSACELLRNAIDGFESIHPPDGLIPYSYFFLAFLAVAHAFQGDFELASDVCTKLRQVRPSPIGGVDQNDQIPRVEETIQAISILIDSIKDSSAHPETLGENLRLLEAPPEKALWRFFWTLQELIPGPQPRNMWRRALFGKNHLIDGDPRYRCEQLSLRCSIDEAVDVEEFRQLKQEVFERMAQVQGDSEGEAKAIASRWSHVARMLKYLIFIDLHIGSSAEDHYEICRRYLECVPASGYSTQMLTVTYLATVAFFSGRLEAVESLSQKFPDEDWGAWCIKINNFMEGNHRWARELRAAIGGEKTESL